MYWGGRGILPAHDFSKHVLGGRGILPAHVFSKIALGRAWHPARPCF